MKHAHALWGRAGQSRPVGIGTVILVLLSFATLTGFDRPLEGDEGSAPTVRHARLFWYDAEAGQYEPTFSYAVDEIAIEQR